LKIILFEERRLINQEYFVRWYMNIHESKQLIFHWRRNRHYIFYFIVILTLLSLGACSDPDTVGIDMNVKDQVVETERSPTQESPTQEPPTQVPTQAAIAVPTSVSGRDGKIAFGSNRDGNSEIYLMDADGRNQINLTNNEAYDSSPTWSPDGSKIAFVSSRLIDYETTRTFNYGIYVMNADGSDLVRLTYHDNNVGFLDWSPDGNKIAYITRKLDGEGLDEVNEVDKLYGWKGIEIMVIDSDGSNGIRLTNNNSEDVHPSWSPDGSKIVFNSDRDGDLEFERDNNQEIYVMNADGSNVIRLTDNDYLDGGPKWSPDGSKIAFTSNRNGAIEICMMDADGSNVICLPNNDEFRYAAFSDWSPDGSKIIFSGSGDLGRAIIYVMNADGSELERLTDNTSENYSTVWQP
jgi:Tol biopolymer transport system component